MVFGFISILQKEIRKQTKKLKADGKLFSTASSPKAFEKFRSV